MCRVVVQARQLGAYIHALVSGQPSLLEQLPWYLQRPITSKTIKPNTNARHSRCFEVQRCIDLDCSVDYCLSSRSWRIHSSWSTTIRARTLWRRLCICRFWSLWKPWLQISQMYLSDSIKVFGDSATTSASGSAYKFGIRPACVSNRSHDAIDQITLSTLRFQKFLGSTKI